MGKSIKKRKSLVKRKRRRKSCFKNSLGRRYSKVKKFSSVSLPKRFQFGGRKSIRFKRLKNEQQALREVCKFVNPGDHRYVERISKRGKRMIFSTGS